MSSPVRTRDLVYDGRWFTPTRDALDAFVTRVHDTVTGTVRVKLFHGDVPRRRTQLSIRPMRRPRWRRTKAPTSSTGRQRPASCGCWAAPLKSPRALRSGRITRTRRPFLPRKSEHVYALVRPVRHGARRRGLRVWRLLPIRPSSVRGRCAWESGVGGRAAQSRRPIARRCARHHWRADRNPGAWHGRSGMGRGSRRGRALVRRAPARRPHWGSRTTAPHRTLEERTGFFGSAAVPAPQDWRAPAAGSRRARGPLQARRQGGHDVDAGLYTLAARTASAGGAFSARACRRATPGSCQTGSGCGGSRRASAGIGCGCGHQLRHRHGRPGVGARIFARGDQQHRRVGRSRLCLRLSCTPARYRWCT